MSDTDQSHTAVAVFTIMGAFATLITCVITRTVLTPTLIAIIVGPLGTVTGFFFGAHTSARTAKAVNDAAVLQVKQTQWDARVAASKERWAAKLDTALAVGTE
jgi:ABC-type bacteriocin/lantibiotic exporter with double-glycine peptidase domain